MHAQVKELCKLTDIKWKLKNLEHLQYIYIFRVYFTNFYVDNTLQNYNLKYVHLSYIRCFVYVSIFEPI
jgi:hypothetical protein